MPLSIGSIPHEPKFFIRFYFINLLQQLLQCYTLEIRLPRLHRDLQQAERNGDFAMP